MALVAVSVTAVAWWYPSPLPDPEVADRTELLYWLVTRDLSQELPETRRTLARRLEQEYSEGIDWKTLDRKMSIDHRKQLWANLPVLLEIWFQDRVQGFHARAPEERLAYVDETIDAIALWNGVESLKVETPGVPSYRSGLLPVLFACIENWKSRAEPPRRDQMARFLTAIQTRWMIRKLSGDLPEAAP